MSTKKWGTTTKELIKEIFAAGGVFVRQNGSHAIYELLDKKICIVPCGGRNHKEAKAKCVSDVRKAIKNSIGK